MYCNCCRTEFNKRTNVPFRGIAAKLCDVCLRLHYAKELSLKNKEHYCIFCGDILKEFDKTLGKISGVHCTKCMTRNDVYGLIQKDIQGFIGMENGQAEEGNGEEGYSFS